MVNYALIINGIVDNIIVADQDFIDSISQDFDNAIIIDGRSDYPSPGNIYDSTNDIFYAPVQIQGDPTVTAQLTAALPNNLPTAMPTLLIADVADFNVNLTGNIITIGCRKYYASWVAQMFYAVLNNISFDTMDVVVTGAGISQSGFTMTFDNMRAILRSLQNQNSPSKPLPPQPDPIIIAPVITSNKLP